MFGRRVFERPTGRRLLYTAECSVSLSSDEVRDVRYAAAVIFPISAAQLTQLDCASFLDVMLGSSRLPTRLLLNCSRELPQPFVTNTSHKAV